MLPCSVVTHTVYLCHTAHTYCCFKHFLLLKLIFLSQLNSPATPLQHFYLDGLFLHTNKCASFLCSILMVFFSIQTSVRLSFVCGSPLLLAYELFYLLSLLRLDLSLVCVRAIGKGQTWLRVNATGPNSLSHCLRPIWEWLLRPRLLRKWNESRRRRSKAQWVLGEIEKKPTRHEQCEHALDDCSPYKRTKINHKT